MRRLAIILTLSLAAFPMWAQRTMISINDCWDFTLGGETSTVSFPHTWNALDCDDDTPGYLRTCAVYSRTVKIEQMLPRQRVTILFEGADQETSLSVNGRPVGSHVGGYTAFSFDITDFVGPGDNLLEISVDNSHNADIPPLSADFTFFGGIYRDVYLIYTPEASISTTHYASDGVYLRTGKVSAESASLNITAMLSNPAEMRKNLTLEYEIADASGEVVASSSRKVKLAGRTENVPFAIDAVLPRPRLWSIQDPYLYKVTVRLRDGQTYDEVAVPLGVRTFSFDVEKGFFLNGEHVKLVGTNRHQDYLGKGNALPDEMHESDVRLLKEMGGNFLRVSHYPQDPVVMNECDKGGIVTSVEIPIVNAITMSESFKENCVEMAREMMYQNFNHPSVIMWAYMNEVCLKIPAEYSAGDARKAYFSYMADIASSIESVFREADGERYTMIPFHSDPELYIEAGIGHIPMIVGFNIYDGWYREDFGYCATRLDHIHRLYPDQAVLVTEYGADVDPRVHSFKPERFDFSCEYGNLYHEAYIPIILGKDFVAGSTVWNLNDFYSEDRGQAVPHVNNKGITGLDRTPKDPYYLYQAYLTDSPVMHICGSNWRFRGGPACQDFKVYTNAPAVKAVLNGRILGEFKADGHIARLDGLELREGRNILDVSWTSASGDYFSDLYAFDYHDASRIDPDSFNSLNVILGGNRYLEDNKARCLWVPEQEYVPGSWGYVGGLPYVTDSSRGMVPASIDNILGTDNNPVFQTVRSGLEAFRADVPDGRYSVYLYFCELRHSHNVFDVSINGRKVIGGCDIMKDYGPFRPVIRKCEVIVSGGQGLEIRFNPIEGDAYLNAVRIYRAF